MNSIKRNSLLRVPLLAIFAGLLTTPLIARAQSDAELRAENSPVAPFQLIGNIYYVGASDVTSFLIVTSSGDILLDGGYVQTAPQIEANIRKLGFRLSDVKILLNSHAHFDHAGGFAELKRRTGARFVAMQGDADLLARGGRGDFHFGDRLTFPPIKPDRIIHDGGTVTLGGVTLTAHLTAGHTRGCTTWTMTTEDHGKPLHVVFIGSMSVLSGYRLVGKESYPGMTADYERSFRVLRSLPCDVFLGSHGQFFGLTTKREALTHSPEENPFVDPAGYRWYVDRAQRAFHDELQRQRAALKSHSSLDTLPRSSSSLARLIPAKLPVLGNRGSVYGPANTTGRSQNHPPAPERTAEALMRVEHDWLAALEHRDVKVLARILGAEFVDSDWKGETITRAEFLAYFARPLAHPQLPVAQHFENTRVRFVANGDVAVVTGVVVSESAGATGRSGDRSPAGKPVRRSRFTDVFVWRDARWQAVTGQETHF